MMYKEYTKWPIVTGKTYNSLVGDLNHLKTAKDAADKTHDVTVRELKTAIADRDTHKEISRVRAQEIETLQAKIKELEGRETPKTFQSEYEALLDKVNVVNTALTATNKALDKLRDLWNWRLGNNKAGPKALAENKDQISAAVDEMYREFPVKVRK